MTLPVSLEEAKSQLKVESNDRDDEVRGFIQDAAAWVETYTGHLLEAREVIEQFRGFGPVTLRAWPIAADAAIAGAYLDDAGAPAALIGARLDVSRRPARALPPVGSSFWPFRNADQLFTVTVQAGYSDPGDVPRNLCRAMLVLIAAYDQDREGGDTMEKAEAAARRLCQRFKRHTL
jgi:uncharacterized phiE125 gp8 family phage protein